MIIGFITAEKSEEQILSVSEALRIIPNNERGETIQTRVLSVRGMISSIRPVMKMISGEYVKCLECENICYERYEKPAFEMLEILTQCNRDSERHISATNAKGDILRDINDNVIRTKPLLSSWPEYRNASIIELQDQEKFDDLERLQVTTV
ncbi:MAG: hypothetical protein WBP83_06585 [Nitrososphaeraceae archaeon]